MIKVAIVEDNEIINHSLKTLINNTEEFSCVGNYSNCEDMLEVIEEIMPHIMLMDIKLPGMNGIEGVKQVKVKLPSISILMLTVHEENDLIFDALCAGACGYLVKKTHPEKILEAIEEAYEGGAPMSSHIARKVTTFFQMDKKLSPDKTLLTPREHEILSELIKGKTYYAIAMTLNISPDTVRFHIKKIYKKLHVHSQAEAVAEAIKKGII
ncbi:MAG: response regulator transcription factor [Melioribacteraceae bacterium]|nr:response regulator transcription factor [Melioribacteraceae bacterium]